MQRYDELLKNQREIFACGKKRDNYCENEENKCYTKLPKRPMMICHKAIHYVSVLMEKTGCAFNARALRALLLALALFGRALNESCMRSAL